MTNQHQCGAQSPGSSRTCTYPSGHTDAHGDGTVAWHNVLPLNMKSREAQWESRFNSAGRNRDEMILQLFDGLAEVERRISALEQSAYADQDRITGLGRQISSLTEVLPYLLDGQADRIVRALASESSITRAHVSQQFRSGDPHQDHQTERASGPPAAARQCATKFREGQCLGYAGHDGDCSVVPDSGNPQLEDPSEFEESTYDRSSDGTPLEGF